METFVAQRSLPSCRVSKGLIAQLEKFLHFQIPRRLQKELSGMMELLDLKQPDELKKYVLTVVSKKEALKLSGIGELPGEALPTGTRSITLELRLGRPEILHLLLVFPASGRPRLELTTVSQAVKRQAPAILDGLLGICGIAANRNGLWHKRPIQALVMLAVPVAMVGYGHLAEVDPFFLYASSGWLVLLGGILGLTLPGLFPWVSFRTRRRFSLRQVALLLLLAATLAAIGGYAWLLVFRLDMLGL